MCTYEDCSFENYESHDKCIFHCKKDDWFTPVRRSWIKKKVEEFWKEIRQSKIIINNQFVGFIFPEFEEYSCDFNFVNNFHQTHDYLCIDNTNFGLRDNQYYNEYYSYLNHNTSFKDATFLDKANFSKIHFKKSVFFENTTFEKDFLVSTKNLSNLNFTDAMFKETIDFEEYSIKDCIFNNTKFLQEVSFEKVKFNNASFTKSQFHHKALFNEIIVSSTVDFSEAIFKEEANYNSSIFQSAVNFSGVTFKNELKFSDAKVTGVTNFSNATFKKNTDFSDGFFGNDADFSHAQFHGDANFTQREFRGGANFSEGIIIKGKALFDVNGIADKADFSEATFNDEFTFKDVEVIGETNFSNTKFKKNAEFANGTFGNSANFTHAQFHADAIFTQREFKSDADFSSDVVIKGKALFDVNGIAGKADFSEATFNDEFTFKNVEVVGGTTFSNTEFKKSAEFTNGTFGNSANFTHAQFHADAIFTQREFKGDADFSSGVVIKGKALFDVNNILGSSSFSGAIFEDDFTFYEVDATRESYFENVTFKKEANFRKGIFGDNISFANSKFHGDALFSQREFKQQADFTVAKFEEEANFEKGSFEQFTIFNKAQFNGNALFTYREFRQKADFSGTLFKEGANFKYGSFETTSFDKAQFKGNVQFTQRKFTSSCNFNNLKAQNIDLQAIHFKHIEDFNNPFKLDFTNCNCGSINFSQSTIGTNLSIIDSNFKELILDDVTVEKGVDFDLKDVTIDHLSFIKYKNKSENVLYDFVTVTDKLDIKHVSFDKERFNHFDISKPNIEIENSAFNSNFFNSVKWGTISEKRYTATRDIFRQLKFFSEQQKNYIDADGFYSLEMKEQKKELLKENKKLKSSPEKVNHFFTNIFVFYLHEKTSDFSQNWWLPIFWLVIAGMSGVIFKHIEAFNTPNSIIALFSYAIFVLILIVDRYAEGKKLPKIVYFSLILAPFAFAYVQVTTDFFDDIARLLNPVNIFKNIKISEKQEFLSLIYKIIVLFLVYQVIASIKKKVRSK